MNEWMNEREETKAIESIRFLKNVGCFFFCEPKNPQNEQMHTVKKQTDLFLLEMSERERKEAKERIGILTFLICNHLSSINGKGKGCTHIERAKDAKKKNNKPKHTMYRYIHWTKSKKNSPESKNFNETLFSSNINKSRHQNDDFFGEKRRETRKECTHAKMRLNGTKNNSFQCDKHMKFWVCTRARTHRRKSMWLVEVPFSHRSFSNVQRSTVTTIEKWTKFTEMWATKRAKWN